MNEKSVRGTALVTGASRGIGKAITAALMADGWKVTGTCRNPKRLAAEDKVPGVHYLPLDLSKKASVEALLRKVKKVDLLVNNAGTSAFGPVEEAPLERVRALFEGNFFGAVRLTQGLLPGMRARRNGTVIFIGSMASEFPRAFMSFYAASKAALKSFSECLRMEVGRYGVRVVLIAPMSIATMTVQENQVKKGSQYAEAVRRVVQVRDRMVMTGDDPTVVGEAVIDILGKRRPRAFTSVGRHARLQAFLIRHMPRRLVEVSSAHMFKLYSNS